VMRPIIGITGRKDTSARLVHSPMYSVGETYVHAVHQAGGAPVILPPMLAEADWTALLGRLEGLLLSGGEDLHPRQYGQPPEAWLGGVDETRDTSELGLIRAALEMRKPIFAICRGIQVLNVALGGTLYQDLAAQVPGALDHAFLMSRSLDQSIHPVTLEADSALVRILGGVTFAVNSAHHQSIQTPGAGLRVVGRAPDGVIEAVELADYPFCIGVQWHPEALVRSDPAMAALFAALVEAASS
ncbi:MAG TPA: gamma-glutamyl-gamma-aminobutyrate hydrolase family protein, partial [Anaerolineae bacterium]|nr:gamma-glutamyl-gamma-aminobutyrate hydrolase family protein [Anaerolineae bacterium]HQJ11342.1 gamma-glutamyl-gamma-aminobutyrate hydrolase family protein [Anaerolineae bacterium]HUM36223.1 gamma-glutamyl-gamma-aminobutyrate hydrolase family protein [Anaerolineae bacterium]